MINKIYVGNLPYRFDESELKKIFSEFGNIERFTAIIDRETGQSKGFCFIEYKSQSEAEAAISQDGKDFMGRPMRVSIAKEKKPGGGSDGRRGGGGGRSGGGKGNW